MKTINIDLLIRILAEGGRLRSGADILDDSGRPLLAGNAETDNVETLLSLKLGGINVIPFDESSDAGVWDKNGNSIFQRLAGRPQKPPPRPDGHDLNLKAVTARMESACLEFKDKYSEFRSVFHETSRSIKENNGRMDMDKVVGPAEKMVRFLMNYDPSLSFLNRSPLTTENYPYHHAINVCNIGVAVLKRFNTNFSSIINQHLSLKFSEHDGIDPSACKDAFIYYIPGAITEIAIGYFMHDIGKALIPDAIINKSTSLTEDEQRIVHGHAHEKGIEILERNHIRSLYIRNIVRWHHAAIHEDDIGGYPEVSHPIEIPPYVKICKLVDIFDAMSSKRAYGEAADPAGVMARIYRKFAGKDPLLQFILHAFISEMGVCPTGSVIHLRNGQLAFVLDKLGPIVLPLTNIKGDPLSRYADPIAINEKKKEDPAFDIDRRKAPLPPIQAFDILPTELKEMFTRISVTGELKK